MLQSLGTESSAAPSARTGPVKLITRSNGSAQSRNRISPSSGVPRSGGPVARPLGSKPWVGPAVRGGRREGGGGGCLGTLRAQSPRRNFPNRRTPAERSSDISAGRAVRKTSSPRSAASSVASAIHSRSCPLSRWIDFTMTTGSMPSSARSTHRPECGYTRSGGLCRERPRPGRAAVSASRGHENCPGRWPAPRTTCRAHARPRRSQSLQPDSALYQPLRKYVAPALE